MATKMSGIICDNCRILIGGPAVVFDRDDVEHKTPGEDFCSKKCLVEYFECGKDDENYRWRDDD